MPAQRNSKTMPVAFKQHVHQCFELPILKPEPNNGEKERFSIVGYWYTHYIDGRLHRQMKLIKHKAPQCLIRTKHDDPAFHVHDFDTTLDRFRRTAVTIDDFEALWEKYLPKSVNPEPSNVKINIPKQPAPIAPPATVRLLTHLPLNPLCSLTLMSDRPLLPEL
eukprot:comp20037_c0_seq3/m.24601 comp20037_c0_seq3/g.24601  ORF comp20037_c0_seq3/g.24601 comp20037_c0_seq3/m.24601 type:complete len:164 (-) comp20037_c0_seq3:57-548(-)